TRLAHEAKRRTVVFEGQAEQPRLERYLHQPVGHHPVDLRAVAVSRADYVKPVRHLLQRFGDRIEVDVSTGHRAFVIACHALILTACLVADTDNPEPGVATIRN